MSFPLPPIEFIEACILDESNNPFKEIFSLSTICISKVSDILLELTNELLEYEQLNRFDKIHKKLKDIILKNINEYRESTVEKIKNIIDMEKNYIWTDDEQFITKLQQMFIKNNSIDNNTLRLMLTEYFNCIKKIIKHTVPKTIMFFLVNRFENNIRSLLCDNIQKKEFYELLEENKETKNSRIKLLECKERLLTSKKLIQSI